ncbi:hypothetical protein HMPREF1544_05303 [Mucor circinelloides 1006PhL]|uniref:MULE transposase domain-containing protein n=1 Tax=Mucor circinelloides f. circinelloides (strain 1006PhL) TaxID=1220926 RepID=S2JCC7_MUCC1|nr:hypothetical protein HMPREF1544_05303 [Mucor circinelloides 1006PhL]
MNDSHITATGSQKREFQSLGSAFDRNDFSDLESLDVDEFASDDEEEVIDFEESSRDMKEELGKTSYVGTKYKTMEGLRKKAQSLDKQFNCPITSAKTSKNQMRCSKPLGGSSGGSRSQSAKELRRLPESVVVDATYKTNSHQLALLNFVVAGTIASEYGRKQLATIHAAGYWIRHESNESYEWAMKAIWADYLA